MYQRIIIMYIGFTIIVLLWSCILKSVVGILVETLLLTPCPIHEKRACVKSDFNFSTLA